MARKGKRDWQTELSSPVEIQNDLELDFKVFRC